MLGRRSRLKPYNEREAVVVGIAVRKDGMDGRRRNRYRKSWLLENVIFTMATDPPTHAPPQPCELCVRAALHERQRGVAGL